MKIKGIIHGKTIELSEEVHISDGTEVIVEITANKKISEKQRKEKLEQFLAILHQDTEELVAVLKEVEKERSEKFLGKLNIL
jgi:3-keto-L-gulonate-6-phosphate decarboxylase